MSDTNKPLISVVAPVYNTSKYLRQCIESVINQSYENWELILVDDGATDESPLICDEYAKKESRIKVIHQRNQGLSVARNNGISAAMANIGGGYLYLLDSDDYLPHDSFAILIDTGRRHLWPDYIKGSHLVLNPGNSIISTKFALQRQSVENLLLEGSDFLNRVILPHPLVWNGLFKKDFIAKNSLSFRKDAWPREDLVFHLDMASANFYGVYTGENTYVYRCALPGSLSNSISAKTVNNCIFIARAIREAISGIRNEATLDICRKELSGTINAIFSYIPRLSLANQKTLLIEIDNILSEQYFKEIEGLESPSTRFYKKSHTLYRLASALFRLLLPKRYRIN